MRGKYSSEEINELIAQRTGLGFGVLWHAFTRDCKSMRISSDLIAEITALRKVWRVILTTDNMDCFDRFTVPALSLETAFDGIANSFNEGCLKTDSNGETFISHLAGEITEAVLVDDSKTTCEFFRKLGGTAYHVTNKTPAIRHLKNLQASG